MSELLEIIMIVLFGISWPRNVYKSYKAKTTKGKSLPFLIFIFSGYISGIISKLMAPSFKWYVLFFYILNLIMVGIDLCFYFINLKYNKIKKLKS